MKKPSLPNKSRRGTFNPRRTIRYYWLQFKRLQDTPQKIAWGMFLGVFIGVTPTVPFHTVAVLFLAPLCRVSPVAALIRMFVMNPITMAPMYYAAYKVGAAVMFRDAPLHFPETFDVTSLLDLLWRGGLALQVGGVILALPSALLSYFLSLWVVKRLHRAKILKLHESASVSAISQNRPPAPGPEA
jgi:uncharacterized protein (DUF2062 family)